MKHASYDEWVRGTESVDSKDPQAWSIGSGKTKFDKKIIEARLEELRRINSEGALERMVYYFDEGTHGNMAGMGSAQLYSSGSSDDRELVDNYVSELANCLDWLSKCPHHRFSSPGKLEFFASLANFVLNVIYHFMWIGRIR